MQSFAGSWRPLPPDEALTLADFLHRPEWHQRAACRGVGVDAFVLTPGKGRWPEYDRRLCLTCPVRVECLDYALANPDLQGLFGATTGDERKAMRKAMRRPRATPVHVPERGATWRGEIIDDEEALDRRERRRERHAPMGLTDEQLRHHAEALLDVWVGLVGSIERMPDSKFKVLWWQVLDRLDQVLDDLLPTLDSEWKVTEYIEYRVRPEEAPYSPAE